MDEYIKKEKEIYKSLDWIDDSRVADKQRPSFLAKL